MSYLFLFFILFLSFFSSSNSTRVPLTGDGWTISNNQFNSVQGQIPGSIHTILLAANQIPDPYLGFNDMNLRYLVYSPWTF
jgi:hypothetical protein